MTTMQAFPAADIDQISGLPDDPLLRILFFLPSASEVARTTVLSTRWRHLWPLASALRFDVNSKPRIYTEADSDAARKLIADASAVLVKRTGTGPNVEDLEVSFIYRFLHDYVVADDPYHGFSSGNDHAADVTSTHVAAVLLFAARHVTGRFMLAVPSVPKERRHGNVDVEEEEEEGVEVPEEDTDVFEEEDYVSDEQNNDEDDDDSDEKYDSTFDEEHDEDERDGDWGEDEEDGVETVEYDPVAALVDGAKGRVLFTQLPSFMRVTEMNLILGQAILRIPDTATGAFGNLTDFRLSYARLEARGDGEDDHRLGHLLSLSCCPRLRRLKLSYITGLTTLRLDAARTLQELQLVSLRDMRSLAVDAPGLRVLRVCECYDVAAARILTPQLEVLAWDQPCHENGLQFDGVAGVRRIEKLDLLMHKHRAFDEDHEENYGISGALWLLRSCTDVHRLVVELVFPHWLRCIQMDFHGEDDESVIRDILDVMELIPELPKIKSLSVNIRPWGHTMGAAVTKFIVKCSGIEHLSIHNILESDEECLYENRICDHPKGWEHQKIHLENLWDIEIHDFILLDSQIRLVGLLLANSPALERMTVALCEGADDDEEDFDVPCYGGHWEPYVSKCSELGLIRPMEYVWMPGIQRGSISREG